LTARRAFVPFPEPRHFGIFRARRQRFLADVDLADGTPVVAHCPNTGSMKGCLYPGHRALLWESDNPSRKLRYTWKAVEADGFWVGVDTGVPNRLAAEAIRSGIVPGLRGFPTIRREVPFGENSRADLVLEGPNGRCFVEVKNVTLVEEGIARFPDAVTERGLKHLVELTRCVREGHRAAMVYVVQREDGESFAPAEDIDPAYARGLREAVSGGVEVYVLGTRVTPEGVEARKTLPFTLSGVR
jgi:sugar fermentation stimulation protein A